MIGIPVDLGTRHFKKVVGCRFCPALFTYQFLAFAVAQKVAYRRLSCVATAHRIELGSSEAWWGSTPSAVRFLEQNEILGSSHSQTPAWERLRQPEVVMKFQLVASFLFARHGPRRAPGPENRRLTMSLSRSHPFWSATVMLAQTKRRPPLGGLLVVDVLHRRTRRIPA